MTEIADKICVASKYPHLLLAILGVVTSTRINRWLNVYGKVAIEFSHNLAYLIIKIIYIVR